MSLLDFFFKSTCTNLFYWVFPDETVPSEVRLLRGETVVVIGSSPHRRGYLVVEKRNHTLHVPHTHLELKSSPPSAPSGSNTLTAQVPLHSSHSGQAVPHHQPAPPQLLQNITSHHYTQQQPPIQQAPLVGIGI